VLAQAATERQQGGDLQTVLGILASDPDDPIAAALARLGQAMHARDS